MHTKPNSSCRLQLLLVGSMLIHVGGAAVAAAAAGRGNNMAPDDAVLSEAIAPKSVCSITIKGSTAGGISTASIACTGAPAVWGFSQALFGPLADSFAGIATDKACTSTLSTCLLGICHTVGELEITTSIQSVDVEEIKNIICIAGGGRVKLQSSMIANNAARGVLVHGGISRSHLTINASRIAGNKPRSNVYPGIAMAVAGNATVQILHSNISDNVGWRAGGGLAVGDNAQVSLSDSCVCGNVVVGGPKGGFAGGVYATGNASVQLLAGSKIWGNVVLNGSAGGVALYDHAVLQLDAAAIVNNTCIGHSGRRAYGGGVSADDHATIVMKNSSRITNNTAYLGQGGGVCLWAHAKMNVANGGAILYNVAVEAVGGGVSVHDNASLTVAGGSTIGHNVAQGEPGGGIYLQDAASLYVVGGSGIVHNRAVNETGGGIAAADDARVFVAGGSQIAHNIAGRSGGGIVVSGNASITLGQGTLLAHNQATRGSKQDPSWAAGGGMAASANATVALTGAAVLNNTAEAAGGFLAAENATVLMQNSRLVGNNATGSSGGGCSVVGNASVTLAEGTVVSDNSALGGGACVTMHNGTLHIASGTKIVRNAAREHLGGGIHAFEDSTVAISGGVQFCNNTVIGYQTGQDLVVIDRVKLLMDDTIQGAKGPLTRCSSTISKNTYICDCGEYLMNGYCACCPVYTFSFARRHRNAQCEKCPEFAFCPGADKIQPLAGYWHSSPQSIQMHQCPLLDVACGGDGCRAGFEGNLCASCAPGYGMRQPLRCGQCMLPGRQLAVYLTLSCLTVLFITLTVHMTWRENHNPNAQLRATDLIKILVQHLQYLVILGGVSAPWPDALKVLFEAASVVFGAASGQVLSLDCVLQHYMHGATVPTAVQRQLVNFLAPVAVFVMVVLLLLSLSVLTEVLRVCSPRRSRRTSLSATMPIKRLHVSRCLPLIGITVLFYAYPTLVKASLSFFACLRIDEASGPYAEYAVRSHSAGYWVYDGLQQECFLGWHKAWALALGLPAVLIFCVFLPAGLFCLLWFSTNRVKQTAFREQYGWLYRNYADTRVWWEPVWRAQTVLLSVVSVFHFSVKAYYSVLLLGAMFVSSAVLQAVAKPYAQRRLNLTQLAASSCLFSTAYYTLALFTVYGYASSDAAPVAVSVLMITLNICFVLWALYAIMSAAVGAPALLAAGRVLARCSGGCRACICGSAQATVAAVAHRVVDSTLCCRCKAEKHCGCTQTGQQTC